MTDEPRFGKTRFATIRRDFGNLRTAIRAHDSFATEAAWEKCERWMEALPTKEQAAHIAAQDAKIAKLVEALRLISSHRRRCHEHDEDMGHDLREFDLEDLKLMEQAARSALASIGETDD